MPVGRFAKMSTRAVSPSAATTRTRWSVRLTVEKPPTTARIGANRGRSKKNVLSGRDRRSERILECRIRDRGRIHAEENIEVVIG